MMPDAQSQVVKPFATGRQPGTIQTKNWRTATTAIQIVTMAADMTVVNLPKERTVTSNLLVERLSNRAS
jgi:hypothetical protein